MRKNLAWGEFDLYLLLLDRILGRQLGNKMANHLVESNPFRGGWVGLLLLQPSHVEQLVDQSVQAVDVFHHGPIELDPLFSFYRTTVKCLKIEFQGCDWGFEFVGDRVDKVALSSIQVDVLDDPDQVQDDSHQDKNEHDRADAQQDPVNAAILIRNRYGVEDIQQDPADGQANYPDDHQNCQQDRPCEAFSFEHVWFPRLEIGDGNLLAPGIHEEPIILPNFTKIPMDLEPGDDFPCFSALQSVPSFELGDPLTRSN